MNDSQQPRFSAALVTQALFQKLTGRAIEITELEPVVVEIHAKGDFVDANDAEVAGVYVLEIDPSVPTSMIAGYALDAFHSTVPVKSLDDFEFTVVMNGVVLQEAPDHVNDEFTQKAVLVSKVSG